MEFYMKFKIKQLNFTLNLKTNDTIIHKIPLLTGDNKV